MKRIATKDIYRVWVLQNAAEGQCPVNVYFKGFSIYSFGPDFILGRMVFNEQNQKAILLTTDGGSASTNRHKVALRDAVKRAHALHFAVPKVTVRDLDHDAAHRDYRRRVGHMIFKAAHARIVTSKMMYQNGAEEIQREANHYAKFFGLKWALAITEQLKDRAFLTKVKAQGGAYLEQLIKL